MGKTTSFPLIGPGVSISLSTFIAWLLISIFEVHDKVYDRYFVKWRYWYSVDFIFPLLFRPLTANLPKRFFEVAREHVHEFMKIFYYFVGDYETKININLVLRFYEKVTKYWITQINEILLFLSLAAIVILRHFLSIRCDVAFKSLIVISLVFIINRIFVKLSRISVRGATNDEIEDIHNNHLSELEEKTKNICKELGLIYGSQED